jgi:hypothetical protein
MIKGIRNNERKAMVIGSTLKVERRVAWHRQSPKDVLSRCNVYSNSSFAIQNVQKK